MFPFHKNAVQLHCNHPRFSASHVPYDIFFMQMQMQYSLFIDWKWNSHLCSLCGHIFIYLLRWMQKYHSKLNRRWDEQMLFWWKAINIIGYIAYKYHKRNMQNQPLLLLYTVEMRWKRQEIQLSALKRCRKYHTQRDGKIKIIFDLNAENTYK